MNAADLAHTLEALAHFYYTYDGEFRAGHMTEKQYDTKPIGTSARIARELIAASPVSQRIKNRHLKAEWLNQ